MDSAYVLLIDDDSRKALGNLRLNVGRQCEVWVYNESNPSDKIRVKAWWSNEDYGLSFNYRDGNSESVVQFGPQMADMLLQDAP